MTATDDLVNYYTNLLIMQYHDSPKAVATIGNLTREWVADMIWTGVNNAFDVNTALGVQLDALGKYVGAFRNNVGLNPLDDDSFRFLIKLKIIQNNSNNSTESINELIYQFFGTRIKVDDNLDMTLTYYCSLFDKPTMNFAQLTNSLPRPAGVATIISSSLNPNGEFGLSFGGVVSSEIPINGFGFAYTSYVGGTMLFIYGS